jgi:hypothetical protein
LPGFGPADIGIEFLEPEVQLPRIKPLRATTELASPELADDEAELVSSEN